MSEVHQIGPPGPPEPRPEVTLQVTADKVIVGSPPREIQPEELKRYYQNSFLLVVLSLLITIWFIAHLKTFMTGWIVFSTMTLLSFLQVILARLTKPFEKEKDDWRKRFLFGRKTRWILCVLIALCIALSAGTSSVHVKLGEKAETPVRIRVTESNEPSGRPSIRLGGDVKIHGAPMFSAFRTRSLVLHVDQPAGFYPEPVNVLAGEPEYLLFPEDFDRQTLVRIHVPYNLNLPGPNADKYAQTQLVIKEGNRTVTQPSPGRSAYIGLTSEATANELIQKGWEAFATAQRHQFGSASGFEIYLEELRHNPVIRTDWTLGKKQTVTAIITIDGKDVMRCSAPVVDTRINDCVMKEI